MHSAPRLSTALFGVALIVGGIVLAADFGGFSTWHAKRPLTRCHGPSGHFGASSRGRQACSSRWKTESDAKLFWSG